mmetsp:Transcript_11538/g.24905  ORF Transcript_11538/g.24905 Transcript_11538/m.24905 type:complete len:392 (+) Transcript_11538:2-1177(+)
MRKGSGWESSPIVAAFVADTPEELLQSVGALLKKGGLDVKFEKHVVEDEVAAAKKKLKEQKELEMAQSAKRGEEKEEENGNGAVEKKENKKVEEEEKKEEVILGTITAGADSIMTLASDLGLVKLCKDGKKRQFQKSSVDLFENSSEPGKIFTEADQLLLIGYALDMVRPSEEEFDDIHGRETLLMWCERQGYVTSVYGVHDEDTVDDILSRFSLKKRNLNDDDLLTLRAYFGDKVALYFAFLNYYTSSLSVMASGGFFAVLLASVFPALRPVLMVLFSVFACVWGVVFIAGWKRRNTEIMYAWRDHVLGDAADDERLRRSMKEELRPQFEGQLEADAITGEMEFVFPARKKYTRFVVSMSVVLLCLYINRDGGDVHSTGLHRHGHQQHLE